LKLHGTGLGPCGSNFWEILVGFILIGISIDVHFLLAKKEKILKKYFIKKKNFEFVFGVRHVKGLPYPQKYLVNKNSRKNPLEIFHKKL